MDDKQINKEFGAYLRKIRDSKGLNQCDIANRVGLSQSHYARIESGERACYLPLAIKICRALYIDINDFLEIIHNKTP